jgi:hypothetical protein
MKNLLLAVAAVTASFTFAGSAAAATVTTVMSGLDNPRGLAFGPEGALYVVEAGRGGEGPCTSSIRPLEPDQPRCFGRSGAVSRLWHGVQQRIVTGLPSYAGPSGQATGAHGIAMLGRGNARVSIGWGFDPLLRETLGPPWTSFDWLARVTANGGWWLETDIGAYELAANPDGGVFDSNAYGLFVQPGQLAVADAGANALLAVRSNGSVSTLATLPSRAQGRPTDAVPTAAAIGPDGAYYLAQLTGVPFTLGVANVYRVVPGEAPTMAYSGFTTIIDLDFGPDGSLYVLEHSTGPAFFALPGRLVKIAPDGTRSTVVSGLNRPGSVSVRPDSSLYVSINSISVGSGAVLRIDP